MVVDTPNRFVYWTMPNGRAMRYGVGIGRKGFAWEGRGHIACGEWAAGTPASDMIALAARARAVPARHGPWPR